MHILITGKPRTGKTTLIQRVLEMHRPDCGGFFTEELRRGGERVGFVVKTTEGEEALLAEKGGASGPHRLGKYGIHVDNLEAVGVKAVERALREKDFILIDEIGKMELFSSRFQDVVRKSLDSGKTVIGVIHQADWPFLNAIRKRPDVLLLEVNGQNNEQVFRQIEEQLKKRNRNKNGRP